MTINQPKMIDSAALIAGMRRLQAQGNWRYPSPQHIQTQNCRSAILLGRIDKVLRQKKRGVK